MKRFIAIIALLSLCSCGSQPSESVSSQPETTTAAETTTAVTEESTTLTEEKTQEPIESETTTKSNKTEKEQAIEDFLAQCEYFKQYDYEEPLKVYEDDNLSVTTDCWIVADNVFATRLIVENKTDKDIVLKSDNSSINEFDINLHIYEHISAGKKKIVFAESDPDELKQYLQGKDIKSVELRFKGVDENEYTTLFETDVITIPINQ